MLGRSREEKWLLQKKCECCKFKSGCKAEIDGHIAEKEIYLNARARNCLGEKTTENLMSISYIYSGDIGRE